MRKVLVKTLYTNNLYKHKVLKISYLDLLIIKKLIPTLIFCIILFTVVAELVGISFEQIKFIVEQELSIKSSILIHIFEIPEFFIIALPYALFAATLFTYKQFSLNGELIALYSFGISVIKIIKASIIVSIITGLFAFCFNEFIVTEANYLAAVTLEKALNHNRLVFEKKDFIYSQYNNEKSKSLKYLLTAKRARYNQMEDLIVLYFNQKHISKILAFNVAIYDNKINSWDLINGTITLVNKSNYPISKQVKSLIIKINPALNYILNEERESNEMSVFSLITKLDIFKDTRDIKIIRTLQIKIQERYTLPFSCIVFSFIGSLIEIDSKNKLNANNFKFSILIILGHFTVKFLSSSLSLSGTIPVWGVWLPNLFVISVSFYFLIKKDGYLPIRFI